MTAFSAAHAAAEDWQVALDACLAGLGPGHGNLGFVYVTDRLAGHMGEIVAALKARTGVGEWIGAASVGIAACAAGTPMEYFDRPAMTVMVAELPADSFRVFEPVGGLEAFRRQHGGWVDRAKPSFGVVHGDPRNPLIADIVAELAQATGAYLVGGLTASRAGLPRAAERVAEGGVSGALFAASVRVATGLTQGCSPIGPARLVTAVEGNVVAALDGRPALDCFKEDMALMLGRDKPLSVGSVHVALPVAGSDTGDYVVRNMLGVDPDSGRIAIGAELAEGDRLMFARRDREGAVKDLRRMLAGLGRRAPAIKGGVYYTCVGRGPNLFGHNAEELKEIAGALGDFPLVGFFANGEICHDRLYGYTGVLTLFL